LTQPLVIEKPQVYQSMKVDPGDLIDLAIVVGRIIGLSGREVTLYKPSQWKGQTPKAIHHERIKKLLSADELSRVVLPKAKKTLGHNVWDAIGLGLFHLGRAGRGK
jgi:hypothetical protein